VRVQGLTLGNGTCSGQQSIANADLEYVKADDFVKPSIIWGGEDEEKQQVWDA